MRAAARLAVLFPVLALSVAPYRGAEAGAVHVDCVVSDWDAFGDCDENSMTQTRSRSVMVASSGYGRACPALSDTIRCRPIACTVGAWSEFSACDAEGYKSRTRSITQEAKYGGAECAPLIESIKCKPVDCLVSRWSDWADAEDLSRVATRSILVPPRDGGRACPELSLFA